MIENLKKLVEQRFRMESADHDWYHIERVLKLAEYIQSKEGGGPGSSPGSSAFTRYFGS